MRITVACPEAHIADANHMAMCLAYSPADGQTYVAPCRWADGYGNRYCCASFEARPEWITAAQGLLSRPDWDLAAVIDMEAATRAQKLLAFSMDGRAADPGLIVAIGGMDGLDALLAMKLHEHVAGQGASPLP